MSNNILFINTTSERLQLALSTGGKLYKHIGGNDAKKHNSTVLPIIDGLLGEAGIDIALIDAIAVVTGPGSFTGIRIGVTTALALRRATGAKIVELTSLQLAARGENCLAYLDCGHDNYYFLARTDGADEYFDGDAKVLKAYKNKKFAVKDKTLDALIRLGTEKVQKGEFSDTVLPFYLKKSSAERENV